MISNVHGVPTGIVVSALVLKLMFPDADIETSAARAGTTASARTVSRIRMNLGGLMNIRIIGHFGRSRPARSRSAVDHRLMSNPCRYRDDALEQLDHKRVLRHRCKSSAPTIFNGIG